MVAVDICNLALSYLGDTATVASIDPPEGSAQAQHCARFYPIALNMLLESHEWNFITRRVCLAEVATDYFNKWRFAYALPSDATDVISVLPKSCYPEDYFDAAVIGYWGDLWWRHLEFERNARGNYQIEVLKGQQVILSNACDAVCRYTTSTVTTSMFPALFTNALARLLASMLAGPILKGDAGAAEGKRQYALHEVDSERAKGQDANQRHGNYRPMAPWMAAR